MNSNLHIKKREKHMNRSKYIWQVGWRKTQREAERCDGSRTNVFVVQAVTITEEKANQ